MSLPESRVSGGSIAGKVCRVNIPVVSLGLCLVLVSLIHIPASVPSLNAFDPAKRLGWALWACSVSLVFLRRHRPLNPRLVWPVFCLAVWMVARSFLRPQPFRELEVLVTWCLLPLLFMAGHLLPKPSDGSGRKVLGQFLVGVTILQAAMMVLQLAGVDPFFAATTSEFLYPPARMIGTVGYQNQAVDLIGVTLAGGFLVFRKRGHLLTFIGVCGGVVLLTAYRGGALAFLAAGTCGCGLAFWKTYRDPQRKPSAKSGLLIMGLLVMLGLLLVQVPYIRERFADVILNAGQSTAVQSRLWFHRVAWSLWQDHLFFGSGAGEYAYQFLERMAQVLPAQKTHDVLQDVVFAREAHWDGVQFGAEFGIVGLVLLAWLCLGIARTWKTTTCEVHGRSDFFAWLWVLVYMCVSSMFNFTWQTAAAGPAAAFLLGVLIPEPVGSTAHRALSWIPSSLIATLGAVALIFLLMWNVYNIRVPLEMERGNFQGLSEKIPSVFHRFRALSGASLAAVGDLEAAQSVLSDAEKGYRDLILWSNLANTHMQKGEWSNAEDLYRAWAASGIQVDEALQNLSVAQESAGDYEAAAGTLSEKLRLWPPQTLQEVQRHAVLYLLADRPKACLDALEHWHPVWRRFSDHDQAMLWNIRGAAYLKRQEVSAAEQAFQYALRLNPQLESARKNLKRLE